MCGRHREGGGVAWHTTLFPRINSHAEARKSAHSSNPHAATITHPAPHHQSVAAHTWCGLSCPHLTAVGFPRHTTPHLLTRHARGGQQCTRRVGGHVKKLQLIARLMSDWTRGSVPEADRRVDKTGAHSLTLRALRDKLLARTPKLKSFKFVKRFCIALIVLTALNRTEPNRTNRPMDDLSFAQRFPRCALCM
jgi:hypothetical protein